MMSATAARAMLAKARGRIDGPRDIWLIARMLVWALSLRVLKHSVALPRLVRLARWNGEVWRSSGDEREKIVTFARWASRPLPWSAQGNCLERSLVVYRYLTAVEARPMLVIGMAPGTSENDLAHGHAWVTVDNTPVGETAASLSDFHPVLAFAADGSRTPV